MKAVKVENIVDVITFDELVQCGTAQCDCTHGDLPWSFNYKGHPITHETDTCYLVTDALSQNQMTPNHVLVIDGDGYIYIFQKEVFKQNYKVI